MCIRCLLQDKNKLLKYCIYISMIFYKIYRFYKLILIALWLEMFKKLSCVLALTIAAVLGEDYLSEATQKGLDYVRQVGIPFLVKEIKTVTIPDVSGSTKTPFSVFTYKLSSIKVTDAEIKSSNITIDEKTGLTLTFENAEFEITSKWTYTEKNWPHIKDEGNVDIHTRNVHLKVAIFIDTHEEKHPLVCTRNCSLDVGYIDLHFHGKASWLYNLFSNKIASDLKGLISTEVCQAISKLIDNEGDRLLVAVPEVVQSIKAHIIALEKEASKINKTTVNSQ